MQQIADWLKQLGMSEYVQCFAENKIDVSVLRHLTDQDLKDIGFPLGHRRKMLAAIAQRDAQFGSPLDRPLPETEIPASQARRRKGRQVFHRITHEHQRLQFPPRGRAPYRSESCRFGKGASLPLRPSSAGAASQEKTHMKNMTANAATASVIATAATIRKSSSIGGLPAAMSVRRIQS